MASDADLIERTRAGDMSAYDELYRRHVDDASTVARIVTYNSDEAQDVVAEAFTRVLTRLRAGGGPGEDFTPYIRAVIRRLAVDRHRTSRRQGPADPVLLDILPDPDAADAGARATDRTMVRRAFEALPAHWQRLLWFTVVEGRSPASLTTELSATPNAISAMAYRAREGLRQAYVATNLSSEMPSDCRQYASQIPAHVRGTLADRQERPLTAHLATCAHCRQRRDELLVLASDLRGVLWPALLVPIAAGGGSVVAAASGGAAGGGLLAWLTPTSLAGKCARAMSNLARLTTVGAVSVSVALIAAAGQPTDTAPAPPHHEAFAPAPRPVPSPGDTSVAEGQPSTDAQSKPEPPVADDTDHDPEPHVPVPGPASPEPEPSGTPDPEPTGTPEPGPSPSSPTIKDSPDDSVVAAGETVALSVGVAGYPAPKLQWQTRVTKTSTDAASADAASTASGGTALFGTDVAGGEQPGWTDLAGATGATLAIPAVDAGDDRRQFRVVATNPAGQARSASATLTVHYAPVVDVQPVGQTADPGEDVVLVAAASANPVMTSVVWQVRESDVGPWVDLPGGAVDGDGRTQLTLPTVGFDDGGNQYRAVFTNDYGSTATTAAQLDVAVTGQLQAGSVHEQALCVRPTGDDAVLGGCDGDPNWRLQADHTVRWTDGRCLTAEATSIPHLRSVVLDDCDGAADQAWTFDPLSRDWQLIVNGAQDAGVRQCLDGTGHLIDEGLVTLPCTGFFGQRFRLVPAAPDH